VFCVSHSVATAGKAGRHSQFIAPVKDDNSMVSETIVSATSVSFDNVKANKAVTDE
jgi:hypothetical protein